MQIEKHRHQLTDDDNDGTTFVLLRYFPDGGGDEMVAHGYAKGQDRHARTLAALREALKSAKDDEARAQVEEAIRVADRRPHPAALD